VNIPGIATRFLEALLDALATIGRYGPSPEVAPYWEDRIDAEDDPEGASGASVAAEPRTP
jgi:hypothetical protein